TVPRGAVGSNVHDATHDLIAEARRILTGLGLFEAQGQTLISEIAGKLMGSEGLVALANPLSSDMNMLRPSVLPGLLDSLRHNLSHKTYDVALFEIGRVFAGRYGQRRDDRRLATALIGQRRPLRCRGGDRPGHLNCYSADDW